MHVPTDLVESNIRQFSNLVGNALATETRALALAHAHDAT